MRHKSNYLKFIYEDVVYNYTKYDTDPDIYLEDENLQDELMSLLLARKNIIGMLESQYYMITRDDNVGIKSLFEMQRNSLYDKEREIEAIMPDFFERYPMVKKTNAEKMLGMQVEDNQIRYLCGCCGKEIPYDVKKKYDALMNEEIMKGNFQTACEKYAGWCPYCNKAQEAGYYNKYVIQYEINRKIQDQLIDDDRYEEAKNYSYKCIESLKSIDPFYEDLCEEALYNIGLEYKTICEINNTLGIYDNQEEIAKLGLEYLKNARYYNTLNEPHDLIRMYALYTLAKVRDSRGTLFCNGEIENICSDINNLMQLSSDIYNYHFPDHLFDELRFCERQKLMTYIFICHGLMKFNYQDYYVELKINETKGLINCSNYLGYEEKTEFISMLQM